MIDEVESEPEDVGARLRARMNPSEMAEMAGYRAGNEWALGTATAREVERLGVLLPGEIEIGFRAGGQFSSLELDVVSGWGPLQVPHSCPKPDAALKPGQRTMHLVVRYWRGFVAAVREVAEAARHEGAGEGKSICL